MLVNGGISAFDLDYVTFAASSQPPPSSTTSRVYSRDYPRLPLATGVSEAKLSPSSEPSSITLSAGGSGHSVRALWTFLLSFFYGISSLNLLKNC